MARKSKLVAVAPETVEPKKPKVLIYGAAGVGKTWFSLDFPSVYYIDCEGGAERDHYRNKLKASGGVYLGPEQGSLDFDIVISQVEALATEQHPYKTIVFDSITKLFNTAVTDEQARMEAANKKDEFGASRKPAVRAMGKLLRWINKVDMNVNMIAHEKDLYGLMNGQREVTGRTFDCWDKLEYELDLTLRVTKIGKGEGAQRKAIIGKSRLIGFPEGETFDWSYAEFASRYGNDVIERAVVPVIMATPEQLAEIKNLIEVLNVPAEIQAKWFSKFNAESFEEMDTVTISKVITSCKERLPK